MKRSLRRVLLGAAALAVPVVCVVLLDQFFPPPLGRLEDLSTVVVDRTGAPLRFFTTRDGYWRLPVTLDDVAPLYLELLVAVEDRRFKAHLGVDPIAVARAVAENLAAGHTVSGASTLTMQLARLLEPRPRTLQSKLLEALRALQLEARYDKTRLLEMYLTLAPFGGNLEGLRAASLAYLGKEPRALTAGEAALLVALPRSPSLLRPDRHPEAAARARERALGRGLSAGVVDVRTVAEAGAEPVPVGRVPWPFLAPHLAERLRGESPGTLVVRTSIDAQLQRALESLAARATTSLVSAGSVAVLVVDHRGAQVIASVGGADYFDVRRRGAIDMTRAVRSPGSALKPFLYGLAFDEGIVEPRTLVADVSTRFRDYSPANFDSAFHGELTVRDALLRSLNVPAVLVLDRLGPARFATALARTGVSLHFPAGRGAGRTVPPGLPLALGGVGMTLEDLTALYVGLARDGKVVPLQAGDERPPPGGGRLLSPESARRVRDILREAAPAPGWVQAASRRTRAALAVKTGTSYGYRDAWAFGVGERYTVGVWVGRPDGTPIPEQTGRTAALPLLYEVFDLLPSEPGAPTGVGVPTGATAPLLRRLEARAPGGGLDLPDPNQLRLVFPQRGIRLDVSEEGGGIAPVTLMAEGGRRPLVWLVDGRPVAQGQEREVLWQPLRTGSVRVSVVDSDGRSDAASVTLR